MGRGQQDRVPDSGDLVTTSAATEVARWNEDNPVGTLVRYWRGVRQDEASGVGRIHRAAGLMRDGAEVAWIDTAACAIALSHIQVVPAGEEREAELFGARQAYERTASQLRGRRAEGVQDALRCYDQGMSAAIVEHQALIARIESNYAEVKS